MNIDQLIKDDFRGCVLISQHGEKLHNKAYGYANLPDQIPNEVNTKFATASAGKVFVAVGILQLIEEGKLHFTDTIGELLDFDLKQIDPAITVQELLSHTSGIPDYFDETVMEEYEELWVDFPNYKIRTNRDLLPLFIDKPMMYKRGEKFQYNNTGFVVLAMIIEQVTNEPFDVYLKRAVFDVCGMNSTGYYEMDRLPAKCANSYIYDEEREEYRTNIYSVDAKGTGAGGAFTTVGDIKLFWQHLLGYSLLSKEMTEDMLSNHSGDEECYGYGIWLDQKESKVIPFFQGCDPGVSFVSCYDREKELLTVVVSNYGDDVWSLNHEILSMF